MEDKFVGFDETSSFLLKKVLEISGVVPHYCKAKDFAYGKMMSAPECIFTPARVVRFELENRILEPDSEVWIVTKCYVYDEKLQEEILSKPKWSKLYVHGSFFGHEKRDNIVGNVFVTTREIIVTRIDGGDDK